MTEWPRYSCKPSYIWHIKYDLYIGGSSKKREIGNSSEVTSGDSGSIECKESRAKRGSLKHTCNLHAQTVEYQIFRWRIVLPLSSNSFRR